MKHWDDSLTNRLAMLLAALICKPLWIHMGSLREMSLFVSVLGLKPFWPVRIQSIHVHCSLFFDKADPYIEIFVSDLT